MSDFSHHSFRYRYPLGHSGTCCLVLQRRRSKIYVQPLLNCTPEKRLDLFHVIPVLKGAGLHLCVILSLFLICFLCFFFSQIMNSWRRKWTRGRWLYRKPNWKPKDWIQMALLLSPHWVDSLLDPNHVSCHFHYLLCSLTALLLRIVYHCCSKHAWLFVWHKISRMSKLLFFFFPIQEV